MNELRALLEQRRGLPLPPFTALRLVGENPRNLQSVLCRLTYEWPDLYEDDNGQIALLPTYRAA